MQLISNNFTNNIAIIDGDAYKWQQIPPTVEKNNVFSGNLALFNPDFSGFFSRLGFEIIGDDDVVEFSSFL